MDWTREIVAARIVHVSGGKNTCAVRRENGVLVGSATYFGIVSLGVFHTNCIRMETRA